MIIKDKVFPNERDLYGSKDITLVNCKFDGIEDGESALKESEDIKLVSCYMNLRYPLWHDNNVVLDDVTMTENCRAAIWYTNNTKVLNSNLGGIKVFRECNGINIENTKIDSFEFGWNCSDVYFVNSEVNSQYLLLMSKNVNAKNTKFLGKYSFQYVKGGVIEDSYIDTKDCLWHSEGVTVKNSIIKSEYLAWYSKNLTLINCKIYGSQPLCYCEGLKLIDCEMIDTNLAFEYSDVDATIKGDILSVKNPKSGKIVCNKITDLVMTEDSKYKSTCEIKELGK